MKNRGNIGSDRAEGTSSSNASGNPSAVSYSVPGSYESFVNELRSQGFTDSDTVEAVFMLERVSYRHMLPYLRAAKRISGQDKPMIKDAHDLLAFDRRFQAVVFKYIGILEGQLRAQYAHWLEERAGKMALYDAANFFNARHYESSMASLRREAQRSKDPIIRSFVRSDADGFRLPVRDAVECMTLGTLSKLISNTKVEGVSDTVAAFFGVSRAELTNWTKTVVSVRNTCAHFDPYVVRKEIPSTPIAIRGLDAETRSTFYVVFILGRLLSARIRFLDVNLLYSFRLWFDLKEVVDPYLEARGDLLRVVGVPDDWSALLNVASRGCVHEGIAVLSELTT